jgi:hypothetical protein
MTPRSPLDPRLLEMLSAHLDGKLEGADRAELLQRLERDAALRAQLEELRLVRDSLRTLPPLKPPRPLTLTREQAGIPARRFFNLRSTVFAAASALATLAFAIMILNMRSGKSVSSLDAYSLSAPMAAQAPAEPTTALEKAAGGGMPPTAAASAAAAERQQTAPAPALPTGERNPTGEAVLGGGCGDCPPPAEATVAAGNDRVAAAAETPSPPSGFESSAGSERSAASRSPFADLATWGAVFLGLAAVGFAVLAVVARRRR